MSDVLFLHIPKTAGTSLRNALIKTFGPCPTPFGASRVSEADATAWAAFPLIAGHISRADQLHWFPDRRIFTVLRDPVDRAISTIYFVKSLPDYAGEVVVIGKKLSPVEFTRHPMTSRSLTNGMIRQLGGHVLDKEDDYPALLERAKETLRQAEWVGFTDTLAADFARVSDVPILEENVTPGRPPADEIPSELIARLREMNAYDEQLLAWARGALPH